MFLEVEPEPAATGAEPSGMFSAITLRSDVARELAKDFEMLTMSETFKSSKPQRLLTVMFRKSISPDT